MKILIATGIYPPDIGGPATYSKLLFDKLPKKGIDVEVLSFGEVRKYPKVIRHIIYFFKLIKLSKGIDLIFAQDTVSVGLPAVLAAKFTRKKIYVRVPGDYAWEQSVQRFGVTDTIDEFQNKKHNANINRFKKIQSWVVNNADKVITPSLYFKKLVSRWMKNPEKIYCIYNGIDLSIGDHNREKIEPKTIITSGRLVPWKGFRELILMMRQMPEWKLSIAGDGPMKSELEKVIEENSLGDRVHLLGQVPRSELVKKIQSSDVFVLNTHFESFSFQVVEAMALGTPVITTNVGNLSEIIDDGENGILVSPDDKKQIVAGCIKLSQDVAFREKIINSAKQKAKNFSIENTLNELIKLLMI